MRPHGAYNLWAAHPRIICKKWNPKATGVEEGQGVVRPHDRGSVTPAGGTAHVRVRGGVSGLSIGVPMKELELHSLGSHQRV